MILSDKEIKEFGSVWGDKDVHNLFDTLHDRNCQIADLKRQLAERDAAVRSMRHLLESRINQLKDDSEFKVWLDAYVQERVDQAVAIQKAVYEKWRDSVEAGVQEKVDRALVEHNERCWCPTCHERTEHPAKVKSEGK